MAEDVLVSEAQRGDRLALDELCRREWRPVYGLLYRAVQNPAEAQDLTQEVFLRALRSFDRYEITDTPFHAYLTTIAKNLLRDRWRRNRLRQSTTLDAIAELPARDLGPEPLALAGIEREQIAAALMDLPEDYRQVIKLRVIDGLPAREVGELMGRHPDAIRQLQRRALLALRARLETELRV